MENSLEIITGTLLGTAAVIAAFLVRVASGVIAYNTGLIFLRTISLGRIPDNSKYFQKKDHIFAVGVIVWFGIAIGIGIYNDFQKGLW